MTVYWVFPLLECTCVKSRVCTLHLMCSAWYKKLHHWWMDTQSAWEIVLLCWWSGAIGNFGNCDSGKGEAEEIRSEKFWKSIVYQGNSLWMHAAGCREREEGKCSCKQNQTSGFYFIKESIQKEGLEPKVGKGAERQEVGKGGVKMRGTKGTHKGSD